MLLRRRISEGKTIIKQNKVNLELFPAMAQLLNIDMTMEMELESTTNYSLELSIKYRGKEYRSEYTGTPAEIKELVNAMNFYNGLINSGTLQKLTVNVRNEPIIIKGVLRVLFMENPELYTMATMIAGKKFFRRIIFLEEVNISDIVFGVMNGDNFSLMLDLAEKLEASYKR